MFKLSYLKIIDYFCTYTYIVMDGIRRWKIAEEWYDDITQSLKCIVNLLKRMNYGN